MTESAKPAELPGPNALPITCGTGWATDAPQLDPTWTVEVPMAGYNFIPMEIDGNELWNKPAEIPPEAEISMVVEQPGTIVLAIYDWSNENGRVDRHDAEGNFLAAIMVP